MEKEILFEITQLKAAISKLIGSADLPAKEQFSTAALDRAAKQF